MKNQFFNIWEFEKAMTYIQSNPLVSKLKFEEYLKKYPKDYSAYNYYISTLITLGDFNKAEQVLNYLQQLISEDKSYSENVSKKSLIALKNNIISNRLRLLAYQERYQELYKYYGVHKKAIKEMDLDLNPLLFLCKKKLNKVNLEERERHTYIYRQIIRYEESEFLGHIKKHLSSYTKQNSCLFEKDFPIEELLQEIKKYLLTDVRLYPNFYVDSYLFKYSGCGYVDNKATDYFEVICFHNTSDIITIYPTLKGSEIPHIDLNYLAKQHPRSKIKSQSQIEKFNQRYKIN